MSYTHYSPNMSIPYHYSPRWITYDDSLVRWLIYESREKSLDPNDVKYWRE